MQQIEFTEEEAHDVVVFLSMLIRGIPISESAMKEYKKFAFLIIQKLLPLCEWVEGEEKCMVTSREQLEKFL